MKAAVLRSVPGTLAIEEVAIGRPAAREVLIRTSAVGVCHSDLHFADGNYPTRTPTVLGHEASGIVEAVGEGVTAVRPGDHVVTCLSVFCGSCQFCLSGRPAICSRRGLRRAKGDAPRLSNDDGAVWQFLDLSSFAEQMLVHENAVVAIPSDMPMDRAALLGCGVTTGVGAVVNSARVTAGETVVVIGCGGVGLNAVQGARIAGAGRIIAVDRIREKLDLAVKFGATDVVDATGADPVQAVVDLTAGGAHHVIEAIGRKETAEQAFAMLAPGGTATLVGMIPVGTTIELPGVDFLAERRIQGSQMGSNRFRIDIPRYAQMYLGGSLLLDELISARIRLDEINDAFEGLRTGVTARSVVIFDQ